MALVALSLAPAASAAEWALQTVPAPQSPNGAQSAVACSSASACTAVGYAANSAGAEVTLAERWNGSTWTIQSTPDPTGATASYLDGVSCPSASACTAVGYYDGSVDRPIVLGEEWNGTSWTIQTVPVPTGATQSELAAVSCRSASACTAVGNYINSKDNRVTLAESWNGKSWTVQSTTNPTGASDVRLSGVSCSSVSACIAVGSDTNSKGTGVTLAERWNGTTWATQTTENASGANTLNGVSCSSASACTAVGSYDNGIALGATLAERWNGTSWTIQSTPNPTSFSFLYGVSCPSAKACTAVGYHFVSSAGTNLTLAETWNGTFWATQKTPNPSAAENVLSAVWCSSASACIAVGGYETLTLAERWDGTFWTTQKTPNPTGASRSELNAVSCSASACAAVGDRYDSAGADVTLAESWSGSSWTIESTPSPTGAKGSYASGVSCPSASACTLAGYYEDSAGTSETLADVWNGTSWTIQTTPNPTGSKDSALEGISCSSAGACTAVGDYYNSFDLDGTLAERWNGTSWAVQTTPNPSGAKVSRLFGVSCPSANACTAVGIDENSADTQVTLAESWNGKSWAVQTTTNPKGAEVSSLDGVSCSSATACTAVGSYEPSAGPAMTLAERWNGKVWVDQTTPNPTGTGDSQLDAVSCTASSACTAVGKYENSADTIVTLAEQWNGTSWTIQTTPNPTGSSGSSLGAVSCSSASACTAVGAHATTGSGVPLAERYS